MNNNNTPYSNVSREVLIQMLTQSTEEINELRNKSAEQQAYHGREMAKKDARINEVGVELYYSRKQK